MSSATSQANSEDRHRHRFLRHCLTSTGVFASLCLQCGSTIAYSPEMRALQIAEESHICSDRDLEQEAS